MPTWSRCHGGSSGCWTDGVCESMNPLVSVVVTTYNQAAYISDTLENVFRQTYRPIEVIVVDDGSTDDTPSRIEAVKGDFTYIRQKNQGVAGSRNTGIRKATGVYIAFLDGDDLWEPEKLSVQVSAALQNPASGLIAVDGVQFEDDTILEQTLFFAPWCRDLEEGSVTTGDYYRRLLQGAFISTTSQVMIPQRVFKEVGMSDGRFQGASDYDLYIRIAARFPITIIKKQLTRWRYLRGSVSGPLTLRGFRYLPEDIAILNSNRRHAGKNIRSFIKGVIRSKLRASLPGIYYYGLEEDKEFASRILWKILKEHPVPPVAAFYLAGLRCPESIRSWCGPVVRKMLSRNSAC